MISPVLGAVLPWWQFPVTSVMGVQVCPLPTAILSNHLGFPSCYFDDYTTHMADYMDAWKKLSLSFEGLYCGFLGSEAQIALVEAFWELGFLSSSSFFLLDPVMGDHGRAYSSITPSHISHMKSLAARADFLTPNITEACLLTDTPFKESGWTSEELVFLCEKLAAHSLARQLHIVITGFIRLRAFLFSLGRWALRHGFIALCRRFQSRVRETFSLPS